MPSRAGKSQRQRSTGRQYSRRSASPRRRYLLITGTAVVALVIGLTIGLRLPIYPAWVAALSVVLFICYGFDKQQARVNGGRVPEVVLHILALAGGFPGGWLGRSLFRHKTLKPMFAVVLTASSLLHIAIALWFYLR